MGHSVPTGAFHLCPIRSLRIGQEPAHHSPPLPGRQEVGNQRILTPAWRPDAYTAAAASNGLDGRDNARGQTTSYGLLFVSISGVFSSCQPDRTFAAGRTRVGPEVDLGRLQPQAGESGADLAAVIRAVVDYLSKADANR